MWSIKRIKENSRGNHITVGKVLGSLKRGVSIDWSPLNIYLHVGSLSGPPRDRHAYVLHVKEARSLGLDLLLAAAELEVSLDAQARHAEERKAKERESAAVKGGRKRRARAT